MTRVKPAAQAAPKIRRSSHIKVEHVSIPVVFVLFILLWIWVARFYDLAIIVPYPDAVVASLIQGIRQGAIVENTWVTMFEALCGFAIAAFAGIVLGSVFSEVAILEKTFYPYIVALQTVPKVALAPLFIIWFGFGLTSKILICALIAFFPILVNTMAGLKTVDEQQIDLFRAHCASRWQIFKWLKFPNALPFVFAGLNIGIVLSIIGAIVGEFVGAQAGLGKLILEYQFNLEVSGVFAVLIVFNRPLAKRTMAGSPD